MTSSTKAKPVPNAADLNHEEFCQPQPNPDGTFGEIRVETFIADRIDSRTGLPVGKVRILRCIECGAQRNTTLSKEQ